MTEEQKMQDCYEMAFIILKPTQRPNKSVQAMKIDNEDPLAMTCLAQLLHSWKYDKDFTITRKP